MQARRARLWIRAGISMLVLLLFGAHSSGWFPLRLLAQLERYAYDARVLLTMPGGLDRRVVIVDVDEKSLAAEGHFPWSRDKLAELVEKLFEHYHIGVLGLDFTFPEADRAPTLEVLEQFSDLPGVKERLQGVRQTLDPDRRFAQTLARHPVATGYIFDPVQRKGALPKPVLDKQAAAEYKIDFVESPGYVGNLPELQAGAASGGFFDNPTLDADGVFRRVPLLVKHDGAVYASLALAVTRLSLGNPPVEFRFEPPEARDSLSLESVRIGPVVVPVDGETGVMVPYRGPQKSFAYISATDVLKGVADADVLKPGVIAILGTSAGALFDLRSTPVSKSYVGVEIHANLISGMLDGRLKYTPPYYIGVEVFMLLAISVILTLGLWKLSPLAGAGLVLGVVAAILGFAFGMWQYENFIMPMGVPLVFTLALFLTQLLYGLFVETRRSRSLTRQFGEYVPPEIVAEMAENPGSASMEGESRDMTVLFSDVRGFTTISEKLEPKDLAQLMNLFLTAQTKVIHRHRGTIDKYMGDAVMAFWGAPLPDEAHAMHALEASMDMIQGVRELDTEFEARGWPKLHIGVGLNTGRMNVGNMGSEFRRAYPVMGDAVNLGSRLEALTREYGVDIIVSEHTRQITQDWAFRELDSVRVKGKQKPVSIFEPLGPKGALDAALKEELVRHRAALRAYRAQEWDQAESDFFGLSRSPRPLRVYELFLERIAFLRQNPPGADWDGAFTFTHK